MSLSVRDDETGLEWAGALGAARAVPDLAQPAAPGVPPDAHRDPPLPPLAKRLLAEADDAGDDADAARVPRARAASRRTSRATSWSRWSRPCGRATPRSRWTTRRATCSPSSSTTACSASSARHLAHGHRRLARVRRSASAAAAARRPHRHQGHLGARDRRRRRGHRRQRRGRHLRRRAWSPPTPTRRWRCSPTRRRCSARSSRRSPYSPNTALLHTDTCCCRGAEGARASWNFRRPADDDRRGVTVTYDLTRLQRLPTDTHYLVTLGGEDLVDPATVIDTARVRAPALHARPRWPPSAGSRDRHRPARLRRRLPRLGLPRGRRPLRPGRRRAARRCTWDAPATAAPVRSPATLSTTDDQAHPADAVPAHLHPPLAHLAGRPRPPARPRRSLGPVRGARPPRRPGPDAARERRALPRRPRRALDARRRAGS